MPHSVKDVPLAPKKQMEFLGKKKSLTSFQTLQCQRVSSSSPLPCTTPKSFNSPAPELKNKHPMKKLSFLLHWPHAVNPDMEYLIFGETVCFAMYTNISHQLAITAFTRRFSCHPTEIHLVMSPTRWTLLSPHLRHRHGHSRGPTPFMELPSAKL